MQVGYLLHILSSLKLLHKNRKSFISPLIFQKIKAFINKLLCLSMPFFCKNGIPAIAHVGHLIYVSCFNSALQKMLIYFYEAS